MELRTSMELEEPLADAAAGAETLDKTSLADLRDGVSARLREANAAARGAPTPDHAAVLGLAKAGPAGAKVIEALGESSTNEKVRTAARLVRGKGPPKHGHTHED